MVSIEDESEKELGRLVREKGLKATKEIIVCIYHIKYKKGLLWYTFADIDYSLPNRMEVSIMKNAPEDKICTLKEVIERMENNFNICFSISQTTSEKVYASFFGKLVSVISLLGPLVLVSFLMTLMILCSMQK